MKSIKKIKINLIKRNSCSNFNVNSSFDLKCIKNIHRNHSNKSNNEYLHKKTIENCTSLPRSNSIFIPNLIKTQNSSNIQNSSTLSKIKTHSLLNITQDNNINNNFNKTASFKEHFKKMNKTKANFKKSAYTFYNHQNKIPHKKLENKNSFLKKSMKKSISASNIYDHYLRQNDLDINKPQKSDFAEYLKSNNSKFNYGLKKIYSIPKSFSNLIEEIKKNKAIAYKKDFDIQEYQSTLIRLLRKRISDKFLESLENKYSLFNERNFGVIIFRGRFVTLANKLKDHLTRANREKIKMLDKGYRKYIEHEEFLKRHINDDNKSHEKLKNNVYNYISRNKIKKLKVSKSL